MNKNKVSFKRVNGKRKLVNDFGLNMEQEKFCQLYATNKDYFGNGVESYAEAYNHKIINEKTYRVAQVCASQLLSIPIICKRINGILEEGGFNDSFIDKQLLFLVEQHSDFSTKIAAIREYNKLKKRTTEKIDLSVSRPFKDLTDEELAEAIRESKKFLRKK